MLVLTRRKGESIVLDVGNGIEITVIEAGNGSVRLGIDAPRSVQVWRKEVLLQVQDSNRAAVQLPEKGLESLQNLLKKRSRTQEGEGQDNGSH